MTDSSITNSQRLLKLFEESRRYRFEGTLKHLAEANLSGSHVRMMYLLGHGRSLPMKDLAETMGFTPPSVTALTRRLVQHGLVQRQAHAEDSRVVLLSLTETGRQLLDQISEEQLSHMEHLLMGLTGEEQTHFLDLFAKALRSGQNAKISGQ